MSGGAEGGPPRLARAPDAGEGRRPEPRRLLARLEAAEPTIEQVQAAAAGELERAVPDPSTVAARRRFGALLPRLSAEVRHEDQAYRVYGLQTTGAVDYARAAPCTTVMVRATWELPDLVAAPGESTAVAASLARSRRRDEVVRRATQLYYDRRRRLLLAGLEPQLEPAALAQAEVELQAVTAELDALTGGLYAGRSR